MNAFVAAVALSAVLSSGSEDPCEFPPELTTLDMFSQVPMGIGDTYRCFLMYDAGSDFLKRVTLEKEYATDEEWDERVWRYSTPYMIASVAHRDAGAVLYVSGFSEQTCEDIVEEWRFLAPAGQRTLSVTSATYPQGVPGAPLTLSGGVAGSGGYIEPGERASPPIVRKREIFRGTLGGIRASVADPEGRFLLIQSHETGTVYSIALEGGAAAPVELVSPSLVPSIASANRMFIVRQDGLQGRIIYFSEWSGTVEHAGVARVVLRDLDNDAIIDGSFEYFGLPDWKASPYKFTEFQPFYKEGVHP